MHTSICLHHRIRGLLALLVALALLPLLAPVPARAAEPNCSVNGAGGADYTSIQAAVNDSGCTTAEHITIARDVSISGAGASSTTVDGTQSGTVFTITSGAVTLQNLTIANGVTNDSGAGINNNGFLTVSNSTFDGNS